jgi:hypothetical protein
MEKGLVFGLNIGELLGIYNPDLQLWKMSGLYLFEDLIPSLDRLPKSGIMQNGRIYEQATWVRRIEGNESGLWLTPSTVQIEPTEGRREKRKAYRASIGRHDVPGCLAEQVRMKMWPTPDCSDRRLMKSKQQGLSNMVKKFPTPQARCQTDTPSERKRHSPCLETIVKTMWPTPTTPAGHADGRIQEWACSKQTREKLIAEHGKELINGQLNPTWVCWLMGYPINWLEENNAKLESKESGTKSISNIRPMRMVWSDGKITKTSSEHIQGNGNNNIVSKMPCESRQNEWDEENKTDAEMCSLRKDVQSAGQSYSQNLQLKLSENPRERKCIKAVAWETEPNIGRLATGIKGRVDRLKALGNSIVPQIAELLFRQIKDLL